MSAAASSFTSQSLLYDFTKYGYIPLRFPAREDGPTARDYLTQVNDLNAYRVSLGESAARICDLSDTLLAGAMAWQVRPEPNGCGNEPPTANKLRATISAIWRRAKKLKLIDTLPEVDRLPEFHREPECHSIDEFYQLIDVAERLPGMVGAVPANVFWPSLYWAVFNTGCRISAVMLTPTQKLDLAGGWIKVNAEVQKHRADMVFDLLPETKQALSMLDAHGRGLARIFDDWPYDRTRRTGKWRTLTGYLRKHLEAAGLSSTEDDLWHKIRRTFATYIAAKAGIAVAQSMLGHSHQRVTKRYIDPRKVGSPSVASLLNLPERRRLKIHRPASG